MRWRLSLPGAAMAGALYALGAGAPPSTAGPSRPEGTGAAMESQSSTSRDAYYLVRPDARRCARPACGGAWVRAANQRLTRCVGASEREQCYVAVVDYGALRLRDWHRARFDSASEAPGLILRGALAMRSHPRLGRVPTLVVSEAWLARAETVVLGSFYLVRDTKVRCITSPCFSLRAEELNGHRPPTSLSALDLEALELPDSVRDAALGELDRGGLIMTGRVRLAPGSGPAGDGRELVATQLLTRFRVR